MATVDGLTKARMLEIEGQSVIGGAIVGDNLILTKFNGGNVNAGNVRGPQGAAGTPGKTVLNGWGPPGAGVGADGDFYIDTNAKSIYGPKAAGAWGGGTSLIGPPDTQSVKLSGDQSVSGVKTFNDKIRSIIPSGQQPNIQIGTTTSGAADSLNITAYGAAAVVLASGADYLGGVSTARAASATQIEFLNQAINFYSNGGLVVGNTYTRTKRVEIDGVGNTRFLDGGVETVKIEAQNKRMSTIGDISGLAGYNTAVAIRYLFGLRSDVTGNADDVVIYTYTGKLRFYVGTNDRMTIETDGKTTITGVQPQLRVTGSTITSIKLDNTGGRGWFWSAGWNDAGSISLIDAAAGNAQRLRIDANGKVVIYTGGGGVASDGLDVVHSPNAGYCGIRVSTNWGSGNLGGLLINTQNAVGQIFGITPQGRFQWGAGRDAAALLTAGATAGGAALPANPQAFMVIDIQGTLYKIPIYNN